MAFRAGTLRSAFWCVPFDAALPLASLVPSEACEVLLGSLRNHPMLGLYAQYRHSRRQEGPHAQSTNCFVFTVARSKSRSREATFCIHVVHAMRPQPEPLNPDLPRPGAMRALKMARFAIASKSYQAMNPTFMVMSFSNISLLFQQRVQIVLRTGQQSDNQVRGRDSNGEERTHQRS